MTQIDDVTVLGTGVLGSQIAYQIAYRGLHVVAYDINDEVVDKAKQRFRELADVYTQQVEGAATGKAAAALDRISFSSELKTAVADADLVIEAIPEDLDIKRATYSKLAKFAPPRTIFATNSSTLLPSDMMESTGRPDKFLALHFANQIWVRNTAEVMGTPQTDPAVYRTVVEFAERIGMVPIELKKEKAGYLLNTLLVPFLDAAGLLLADGVADPETIDKTWRLATGAPLGPCQMYDIIGLTTPYNIASQGNAEQKRLAKFLKENYLDKNKLGIATGEGFYTYPQKKSPQ